MYTHWGREQTRLGARLGDDMCECGHNRDDHESRGVISPCNHKDTEVKSPEDMGTLHRYGYTRHCVCYDFKLRRTVNAVR